MAFHVLVKEKKLEVNDKDNLPFFICVKLLEIDSVSSYILLPYLTKNEKYIEIKKRK